MNATASFAPAATAPASTAQAPKASTSLTATIAQKLAASPNVTQSLKPTSQTASCRLLLFSAVAALVLPILYPLACNLCLPAADASVAKALFFDNARVALPYLLGFGGGGVVGQSVAKTIGKIFAQLLPGVVTDATPNGEGVSTLAPLAGLPLQADHLVASAPSAASEEAPAETIDDIVARSGFDLRDSNIGAPTPSEAPANDTPANAQETTDDIETFDLKDAAPVGPGENVTAPATAPATSGATTQDVWLAPVVTPPVVTPPSPLSAPLQSTPDLDSTKGAA